MTLGVFPEVSTVRLPHFGPMAGQISQESGVIKSQLRGMQPTRGFGGIEPLPIAPGAHGTTGELSSIDAFRRDMHANIIGSGIDARTLLNQTRLAGPVQFLKNLLDTWRLDLKDATVLLGMDPENRSFAEDLLTGRITLSGRDAKDRIAYLYRIRKLLSALFRDEEVENQWLRESHTMLDECSPMGLIMDGSMENLLLVKEYVEAATGH